MNSSSAVTDNSKQQATLRLYDILIPTIGSISILLNFAVVISSGLILKKGQQPRTTYLFLGNVAMTDLVTSISVIFGMVYPNDYREHYICSVQIGMIVSSTLASVFSLGLIAIDRYLYILHGLRYQQWVYPTRARFCICVSWIIGCIIGFLPLLGWYGDTQNGKKCWFILLAPKSLIVLTVALGCIPLLLVPVLYSIILYHAIKNMYRLQKAQEDETQANTNVPENALRIFRGKPTEAVPSVETKGFFRKYLIKSPSNKVKSPKKWKAIKIVLFTSGSFLLTWGPYFVVSLMYVYCKDKERSKNLSILIASPLAILGFCNTLINPVIYAWWHNGFRAFVKQTLLSVKWKRASSTPSKSTSSTKPSNSLNGGVQNQAFELEKAAAKTTEPSTTHCAENQNEESEIKQTGVYVAEIC